MTCQDAAAAAAAVCQQMTRLASLRAVDCAGPRWPMMADARVIEYASKG